MCAAERRHLRGQRLQQVLPELQRHEVGQATKGKEAVKRRHVKETEGLELAGDEREGGGNKRGRLASQMAGLFVWAAWHGEGLSICLSTDEAQSPEPGCLRAHWPTELHSFKNLLGLLMYQGSDLNAVSLDQFDGCIRKHLSF